MKKPEPKFKVGDWVKLHNPYHPLLNCLAKVHDVIPAMDGETYIHTYTVTFMCGCPLDTSGLTNEEVTAIMTGEAPPLSSVEKPDGSWHDVPQESGLDEEDLILYEP